MKIAIVHNLPAGGQKRALFEQCRLLSKKHKLDLFTLTTANEEYLPLKPFIGKHFEVEYRYPQHFPQTVISIFGELRGAYRKLGDIINKGNYDLAFVSPCFLTQAPYILRYLKIPSVYHCAEPKREFYEWIPRASNSLTYWATFPFRLPIKYIDRTNVRHASKVISISDFGKKRVNSIYNVASVRNYLGINTEQFVPIDRPKSDFVLTVGNFSLHKGHDFLIKSIGLIPEEIRPILIITGQGGIEKEYLQNLAFRHHVPLQFKENISDKELLELYNEAKLFVFAARNEPFGLVLLEAAACGLPVLAVDEGGVGEIVDKRIGQLTGRNEKDFAGKIIEMMSKSVSFKERQLRNIYVKHKWSWERSVTRLENIFFDI